MSQSRVDRVTALLQLNMSEMNSYHDHKETMAHASILVTLAYVGSIITLSTWPPVWIPNIGHLSKNSVAMIGAMAVWLFIHTYMRWQLRKRRIAAKYVVSILQLLRKWSNSPPKPKDLKPYEQGQIEASRVSILIDFFFPLASAPAYPDEGMHDYPEAMVIAFRETETGALFAERLLTLGSYTLGLILLLRTWP